MRRIGIYREVVLKKVFDNIFITRIVYEKSLKKVLKLTNHEEKIKHVYLRESSLLNIRRINKKDEYLMI